MASCSSEGDTHVIVRIPTFGHEWVAWVLDAGAAAIVIPHVSRNEQQYACDETEYACYPVRNSRAGAENRRGSKVRCCAIEL